MFEYSAQFGNTVLHVWCLPTSRSKTAGKKRKSLRAHELETSGDRGAALRRHITLKIRTLKGLPFFLSLCLRCKAVAENFFQAHETEGVLLSTK